jgi:hypothetical protein
MKYLRTCSNCDCTGGRESKYLSVTAPWGFNEPWISADSGSTKYEVQTVVSTNTTGTSTSVSTYDHDNGAVHNDITSSPGYDGNGFYFGDFVSTGSTATVKTDTYTTGSIVSTLSVPVTLATKTTEAQTYLDSLVATHLTKLTVSITAYIAGSSSIIAWCFRSIKPAFPNILPGEDFAASMIKLSPDSSTFPWNGHYIAELDDLGHWGLDWYFATYGWSADGSPASNLALNYTYPNWGYETFPTSWGRIGSQIICGKSCHALPDGIGCATAGVPDLVATIIDPNTDRVTTSTCMALGLSSGFYCFGKDGIFSPGNPTPIVSSYSPPTEPGFMVCTSEGSGGGSFFLNELGPLGWTVTCCP